MTTKKEIKTSLLKVAYVSRVHGLGGEIFVRPLNKYADWPSVLKEIFIGDRVFEVLSFSSHKGGMIFQLKGLETKEQAEALKDQDVFLRDVFFKSQKGEAVYLAELQSFTVEFSGRLEKGRVQSFQSSPHQDFLLVEMEKRKAPISIPFISSYIEKLDFEKKRIVFNLPENFLEVF